jgi:hypothetical protein
MANGMEREPSQLRAEHDAVLERVSSRESIGHFAHGIVAGGIGALFLAAAGKLWWDFSEYHPEYHLAALVISTVTLGYSAVRLLIGRATFRREATQVARLFELRKALSLDVPGAMLPR